MYKSFGLIGWILGGGAFLSLFAPFGIANQPRMSDANQAATVLNPSPWKTTPALGLHEDAIQALKQVAREATDLDADTKTAVLGFYDKALTQHRLSSELKERIDQYLQKQKAIPDSLVLLREQLSHPNDVEIAVKDVGLEQATEALSVAQQTLTEARQRVLQLEAEAKHRGERLAKIPAESSDTQNQLTVVQEQLQSPPSTEHPALWSESRRLWWRCQAEALGKRLEHNQVERQYYAESDTLLVAERAWAARQVVQAERQATQWQRHLDILQQEKLAVEQEAAAQAARAARFAHPAVKNLAEKNSELTQEEASLVSKLSNIKNQTKNIDLRLASLLDELEHLQDTMAKSRSVTSVMGTFLIAKRASLPLVEPYRHRIRERIEEMSQAQIEWMNADQQWSRLVNIDKGDQLALLVPDLNESELTNLRRDIVPLLQKQQQFWERIRKLYLDYSTALAELDTQERNYLALLEDYVDFLDAHILWARSPSPFKPSQLRVAGEAFQGLMSTEQWQDFLTVVGRDIRWHPSPYVLLVVSFIVLMGVRRWACNSIRRIADHMNATQVGSMMDTLAVLVLTALIPWAWAGGVWLLQNRLSVLPQDQDLVTVVRGGLQGWAWLLLMVGIARAIYLPQGLADLHLRVKTETVCYVRRQLTFLCVILMPLTLFWRATIHHSDPRYINTLGALAFIAEMLVLAVFTAQLLRLRGPLLAQTLKRQEGSWFYHLRYVWYGAAVAIFLLIATLTTLGYLYAGWQLLEKVGKTVLVILLTLLLYGLFKRWLWVTRYKLAVLRDQRRQTLAQEISDSTEGAPPIIESERAVEPPRATIFELSTQTKRIVNMIVFIVLAMAFWQIWNDLLPALESIVAVELWKATTTQGVDEFVTLGALVQALVIALMTVVTARNVPGLLEMLILGRLPLDRGLRFAIVTLCRYLLMTIGMILTFNQIGIGWGKVQWLVAAMTVGLGFGLQEIFANFVSGLIILVERPIRVDDVVTVGDISGRVTTIKTRATTILRWDSRELIVPNKEFVTGQLINWTLSNNVVRKEFCVGIAYGSDTAKAEGILYEIAVAHRYVLKEPPPIVIFREFGNNSLDFELRVFLAGMDNYLEVWHEINNAIDQRFREAGIEIAFPQRDLHLRSVDPNIQWSDRSLPKANPS